MKVLNFFKKKKENSIDTIDKVEIEKEVKAISKKIDDGEPSWYHYVIIFLVLGGILGVFYGGFEIYDKYYGEEISFDPLSTTFNYPYQVGNITYNIQMHYPIDEIKKSNYSIEVSRLEILNSIELIMSFDDYNGTDNGKVTIAGSKLTTFFKKVYHFSFDAETNFKKFNESNCETSDKQNKVIMYNPYSNRSGVFYNSETSCIEILSQNADEIVKVTDYFMYTLMNE